MKGITIYRHGFLVFSGRYDPATGALAGYGAFSPSSLAALTRVLAGGALPRKHRYGAARRRWFLWDVEG